MKRVESTRTGSLGDAIAALLDAPAQVMATLAESLTRRKPDRCDIPPPCWEPQPAGTCRLAIPPGCVGKVRIHVANCDWTRHVVVARAMGRMAGWMTFDPTTLVIDPQEQRTIVVTVKVPSDAAPGQTIASPILVYGCNDYVVHVEVSTSECASRICCDVFVRDCPDHLHHWYDHFYCARPCKHLDSGKVTDG
jgi:hypothetical protein